MERPMYQIEADRERALLRLKLSGMWDMATAERFEAERRATVVRQGWSRGDYRCIVDLRDYAVQPREVAARGEKHNHNAALHAPRKTALIVGSMLQRMQVQRVVSRGDEQVFTTEQDAISWLDSPDSLPPSGSA